MASWQMRGILADLPIDVWNMSYLTSCDLHNYLLKRNKASYGNENFVQQICWQIDDNEGWLVILSSLGNSTKRQQQCKWLKWHINVANDVFPLSTFSAFVVRLPQLAIQTPTVLVTKSLSAHWKRTLFMRSLDTPLIAEHNMFLIILAFQICLRGNMHSFMKKLSSAVPMQLINLQSVHWHELPGWPGGGGGWRRPD